MASLEIDDEKLQLLRETLCIAQKAMLEGSSGGMNVGGKLHRIDELIREIDRNRPVGPDGRHGNRMHTETCGCADKPGFNSSKDPRLWDDDAGWAGHISLGL